jgi:hypothetical protein
VSSENNVTSKNEYTSQVAHYHVEETSQAPGRIGEETHGNTSEKKMYSVALEEKRV